METFVPYYSAELNGLPVVKLLCLTLGIIFFDAVDKTGVQNYNGIS